MRRIRYGAARVMSLLSEGKPDTRIYGRGRTHIRFEEGNKKISVCNQIAYWRKLAYLHTLYTLGFRIRRE